MTSPRGVVASRIGGTRACNSEPLPACCLLVGCCDASSYGQCGVTHAASSKCISAREAQVYICTSYRILVLTRCTWLPAHLPMWIPT
ncbi:hypothetical protein CH063_08771 [Colletotrichum higginsianum]|uniref:Uncharacterized protein n=1 Tax=Colletotrichum higginsianum (strain IMI 349063) TaxID=759273 RepID=H1VB41_COLHI|nr:hypothetical protein CH063_08771 [Colletotrichum higginsianum]